MALASGRIEKIVDEVRAGYERLVLIVGPPGSGKSAALRDAAGARGWPVINLSLDLAQRMLELPVQQRPGRALDTIRALLDELDSDVACLDNIELLFGPSLQLDPLGLLQSLSRQKTLVAVWHGGTTGKGDSLRLIHAQPSHPEYRDYSARGLVLLSVPAEE
jgi:hypothetical protein